MPSLLENLTIIETAVYGKEMRPAIKEALTQTKELVDRFEKDVESLNSRVDALSGGGGGGGDTPEPDNPDTPDTPSTPTESCGVIAGIVIMAINGAVSTKSYAGLIDAS